MWLLFLSFLCLFFLCFHSFKNNSPWREQMVGLSIAFCHRIPQFHPCVVLKFPCKNCRCSHCGHIYLHPLEHCFKVMPRNTFLMFVRETFHKLINVSFWGRSLIHHYGFPTAHLSTPEGFQAGSRFLSAVHSKFCGIRCKSLRWFKSPSTSDPSLDHVGVTNLRRMRRRDTAWCKQDVSLLVIFL